MLINSKRELVIDIIIIIVVIVIGFLAFKNSGASEPKYMTVQTSYKDSGGPCAVKYEIMIDENDIIDFIKNGGTSKFDLNNEYANDPTEDSLTITRKKDNYEARETEWERKVREAMEKQGYYKDGRGVWVKPTPLISGQKEGSAGYGKEKVGFKSKEPRIAEKGEWLIDDDGNSYQAKGGEKVTDYDHPGWSGHWKMRLSQTKSGAIEDDPENDTQTYTSDGKWHSYMTIYVKEGNITSYARITRGYSKDGGPCNYDQTLTGGNMRGKVVKTDGYTYDYNDESDYEIDPVTGKPKLDINGFLILKKKNALKDNVLPQDEKTINDPTKNMYYKNDLGLDTVTDGTDNGTILPEYIVPLGFSGAVQKLGVKDNDDVRLAQLIMYIDGISKGTPSRLINGNLSGMTQRSIMQFQKQNDLGATGLLDTPTQDLMQFYVDELIAGPEFEDKSVEVEQL